MTGDRLPETWRPGMLDRILHALWLCPKGRAGYDCLARHNYRECGWRILPDGDGDGK